MTAKEIQKIINRKGRVAQDTYNAWVINMEDYYINPEYAFLTDPDIIAIFSFNCTILAMKKFLAHPEFFEKKCSIMARNRERMYKDLETMKPIDYPEGYEDIDFDYYAQLLVDDLPVD